MGTRHQLRNPLMCFSDLLRQPSGVAVGVFALMVVNLAGVAFWSEPLARAIVAVFLLSAMLMMGLYAAYGFERILGLCHVLWIPFLVVLVMHLPQAAGAFAGYLIVLVVCIGISLLFDVRDVWIYVSNKRARQ